MNIKAKTLYITTFAFLLNSCTSQKNIKNNVKELPKIPSSTQTSTPTTKEEPKKIPVQHIGQYDFFKTNIADPTKNDNTISHGSIVSANPKHYKVTKNYFPAVGQNFRQRYIVLHYTALDNDRSLRVLTEQGVSAHYLVNDLNDNEIYQLVDENKRAYHAGISYWRKISNLNDTSIGIEIVNKGYTTNASGEREFYPYPEWQFHKVASLIKDIAERYNIPATNILAHSDIAPTRKQDPGPQFPWKKLYTEYGIGMWYDDTTKEKYLTQAQNTDYYSQTSTSPFIFKYQTMLNQFGYDINPSGSYDDATKKTIEAFQFRFRPEEYSGVMDIETYAILQALLEKYPNK